jgi:hypothetical protein
MQVDTRNGDRVLVGKPEEKTHGRTPITCEDNIKMDFKAIGWNGVAEFIDSG